MTNIPASHTFMLQSTAYGITTYARRECFPKRLDVGASRAEAAMPRLWPSPYVSQPALDERSVPDRAPGYLLGSIYINYGVTAVLVVILYFGLFLTTELTGRQLLYLTSALALLFPLWFFRYARALWIAMDEKFDPWPNEHEARELANRKS